MLQKVNESLDKLTNKVEKIETQSASSFEQMNARIILLEGRMKFVEAQKTAENT